MIVLDRAGEAIRVHTPPEGPAKGLSFGAGDKVPSGPYRIGMTWVIVRGSRGRPDTGSWSVPYTILARNGLWSMTFR